MKYELADAFYSLRTCFITVYFTHLVSFTQMMYNLIFTYVLQILPLVKEPFLTLFHHKYEISVVQFGIYAEKSLCNCSKGTPSLILKYNNKYSSGIAQGC